jgi:aminoglycoside 3'-phosphotransferase-2
METPQPRSTPPAWQRWVGGYRWRRQRAGLSGAELFRLEASGQPSLFVKVEPAGPFSEVQAEAMRLPWLGERGIACPAFRDFQLHDGRNWLLTDALPGRDMASLPHVPTALIIQTAAEALRGLHARSIEDCPFDQRLASRIVRVRDRLASGGIEDGEFREEGGAAKALETLLATKPDSEELVLTHGDACLPNLLMDGHRFGGFVDCGRFGIADRYQDLALTCDSIGDILGEAWITPFLSHYGVTDPDPRRLVFYERFDGFF